MAKAPRNRQLNHLPILAEMDSLDNRTSAIVAASLIENNLALAIMGRFRTLEDNDQKCIFEDRGVLSDFSSKIDIGFALNLYGRLVRDDLHKIRQIRNQFAHHLEVRDFDHPEVAGKYDGLNARRYLDDLARPKHPHPLPRKELYLAASAHLGARFDLEARAVIRPQEGLSRIASDY